MGAGDPSGNRHTLGSRLVLELGERLACLVELPPGRGDRAVARLGARGARCPTRSQQNSHRACAYGVRRFRFPRATSVASASSRGPQKPRNRSSQASTSRIRSGSAA